jgi:hypothetical protein
MLKEIFLHLSEITLIIVIIIKFYLIVIEKYYEILNRVLVQNYIFQTILIILVLLLLPS